VPPHVAAYLKSLETTYSIPSVKQQLAAIRMPFDFLVIGQAVPLNPASPAGPSSWRRIESQMRSAWVIARWPMSLGLDFAGRMQKIRAPVSRSLHAVFEAVANSFDATEHLGDRGRITVRIIREEDRMLFSSQEKQYVLKGYEIEDNGVGFTDKNMEYFKESDTTNKVGGKGVGRFLWLKIFDSAQVVSTYKENGSWQKRDFPFSFQKKGVDEADIVPQMLQAGDYKTTIRLEKPKADRIPYLVQESKALAARLLEHFLLYFAVLKGPKVSVISDYEDTLVEVGGLYQEIISDRHKKEDLEVGGRQFSLHHLFVKPTTTRKNLVRFCARRRVVISEKVSSVVPEVSVYRAVTVQQNFRYHAYVTGDYLDEITDDERSDLKFPKGGAANDESDDAEDQPMLILADEEDTRPEGVTKEELYRRLAEKIRGHLGEHIADVRKKQEKQLEDFAHKEQPQFRPFLDLAKKNLDRLPARPNKRDIEIALYQAKIDGRADLEKSVAEIVKRVASADQVAQHSKHLIDKFASEANRQAISAPVEYVCTRKAVINVLKANLGKQDGKYEYEEIVHDLFFPRHITSDSIPVGPLGPGEREIENLWLIDERLVFHRLLTSDKPLSTLKKLLVVDKSVVVDVSEKNDEPDILIFDPALVTAESENFETLGIVEFKRPGRDDYTLAKNPVQQIIDIARKIRDAKHIETKTGQIQAISDSVRFYGYAICDLLGSLRGIIEDTHRMQHTPDGIGYYGFHHNLNLLIEVIPYSKIVSDAERRNAAFFTKLGM
jgi:hypothetical protein